MVHFGRIKSMGYFNVLFHKEEEKLTVKKGLMSCETHLTQKVDAHYRRGTLTACANKAI